MPVPPDISIEVFGKTDVGLVREHNEDNFLVADVTAGVRVADGRDPFTFKLGERGGLMLVCDGMGGAAAGEVASQMAVDPSTTRWSSPSRSRATGSRASCAGPSSRPTRDLHPVARQPERARDGDDLHRRQPGRRDLVVAQIGDSRCYVLRDGKLAQVTKDQSLAWQLIEAGAMTADEAKAFEHANIILQALGVQERVEVVLSQVSLRKGDIVLLCSDGLHGPVADEELLAILIGESNLKTAGEALIQKALDRDGPDNITVVLARFDGEGLSAPTSDDVVGFVGYDPGSDPVPEPVGGDGSAGLAGETVQERLPRDMLTADDVPTKADPEEPTTAGAGTAPGHVGARTMRSLVTLFLLALVAAAAGGVFVMKCDRDDASPDDIRVNAP